MYKLEISTRFKKDLKKIAKNPKNDTLIRTVLKKLKAEGVNGIPTAMKPHRLSGQYRQNWECHIRPDLLIIWFQIENPKTIRLIRIGSHSDLF
jgi:mRNA interferase YafQ